MMKMRTWAFVCALVVCLALVPCVNAEQYPVRQGAATDLADVLGAATVADIEALSGRYAEETGGTLSVVTRHFLGGADAKGYAEALFSAWTLDESSALLLMVVGEDSYALYMGERARSLLPRESADALLSSQFRAKFMAREYDAALSAFLPALVKKLDADVSALGLFGQEIAQSTPAPVQDVTGGSWAGFFSDSWRGWTEAAEEEDEPDENWLRDEEKNTGFSFGRLVVIGLVLYFLFGRKKNKGGCGCGPIGWILGTFGLADLFGLRKK